MKKLTAFKKLIFFFIIISSAFVACRKTLSVHQEMTEKVAAENFYRNSEKLNPTLQNLVNSFKKQSLFNSELSSFIEKNGVPVWDKTIYQLGSSQSIESSLKVKVNGANSNENNTSSQFDTSKGIFLIPLKSPSTGNIQSYITAYKHDDSTYSYRLYNRDSVNRVHPKDDSAKINLRNTNAVFGVFEKKVNNVDSIKVSDGIIRSANISFSSKIEQTNTTPSGIRVNDNICLIQVTMTLYYEWQDFSYPYGNQYQLIGISLEIDILCWADGNGGGGGQSLQDPGTNYWWQYGTGWPWNVPSLYGNYDPWNTWWNSYNFIPANYIGNGGNFGISYDLTADEEPTDSDLDNLNGTGPTDYFPNSFTCSNGDVINIYFGTSQSDNKNAYQLVSTRLIKAVLDALELLNQSYRITSINISCTTNGDHDSSSNHYKGLAVDISRINGIPVVSMGNSSLISTFQSIYENIPYRRENFGPSMLHKLGVVKSNVAAHDDHIHFSVNGQ